MSRLVDNSDAATRATALKRRRIKMILQSLRKGSTFVGACDGAGIDVATFWRWRKKSKRLDDLAHAIVESRVQIVEDALYKSAVFEGSVPAQMFFLTRRASDRWPDQKLIVNNVINNMMKAGKLGNTEFVGADAEAQRALIDYLRDASK